MRYKNFLNSTLWSFSDQFATQFVNFLTNILLVRLLTPEDFGVFVTPFIIFMFGRTIQDLGTSKIFYTLVSIPIDIKRNIFGFNLITTLFFGLLMTFLAPDLVYIWTKTEVSSEIMFWLGISYFFSTPLLIHDTLLKHQMRFKRLFLINMCVTIMSSIIGIYLATEKQGYWSILVKHMSYIILSCVLLILCSGERLKPKFNFASISSFKTFSFPLLASDIIGFFSRNIDNLFIDRFMGAQSLGIYERGYRFLTLPIEQVAGVISKVLLPSLTNYEESLKAQKLLLKFSIQFSFATILPLVAFLVIFSEEFVFILFGQKWEKLIPLLKIFALITIFQIINSLLSNLFIVKKDTKSLFFINMITQPFHITNIIIFTVYNQNLIYLTLGYGIISIVHSIIFWTLSLYKINENIYFIFNSIRPFLIASLILIFSFLIIKYLNPAISFLIFSITLLILLYYALIYFKYTNKSKSMRI